MAVGKGIAAKVQFAVIGLVIGLLLGILGAVLVQTSATRADEQPSVSVVFDRIVSKSELVSASQSYNITDRAGSSASFFDLFDIPFTDNSFWYRYVGTIKAGVNLESAEFSQSGDTITVMLDQPTIISNTPNMDESGVMEERNNIFNPIQVKDVEAFQRQCVQQSESAAIEGGLLDEARTNAEQDITDMFNAAMGNAYQVAFVWREAASTDAAPTEG